MGVLSNLFGGKKAKDDLLDKDNGLLTKAGGWIGSFQYTPEEKAKADKETREWGLRALSALEPFKVVQRILAFSIIGLWFFGGINVIIAVWIRAIWPNIDAVTPLLKFILSDYVLWPALAVTSLYFTGGVVNSFTNKSTK
jgi:hypothetical protein